MACLLSLRIPRPSFSLLYQITLSTSKPSPSTQSHIHARLVPRFVSPAKARRQSRDTDWFGIKDKAV